MAGAIGSRSEVSDAFIFAPNVFVFQCWSIPKRGPGSNDGTLEEFIPEKLNRSDDIDMPLSPPQLYGSKPDVEFRNCVIGESALGGCADPLSDVAGSWKLNIWCWILSTEGVVWTSGLMKAVGEDCEPATGLVTLAWFWFCGLMMAVGGDCERTSGDGFSVIGRYCELATGLVTLAWFWFCGLMMVVGGDCEGTSGDGLSVIGWYCELPIGLTAVAWFWCCGLMMAVGGDCEATSGDGFSVIGRYCELATGLATMAWFWCCGLMMAVGGTQSDARLWRSSIASFPIRVMHMVYN